MPLKVLVFTDVVGSSNAKRDPHFGPDGQTRDRNYLEKVQKPHFDRVRTFARRFQGKTVGDWGDAFYIAFDSAIDATRSSVELLRSLRDDPIPLTPGTSLALHIGVHAGEVQPFEHGWHGTHVDAAARVQSISGTNQILISDTVRRLIGEIEDIHFHRLGDFVLKGVGHLLIWEADWDGNGPRHSKKAALGTGLDLPPFMVGFVGRRAQLHELDEILTEHQALFLGGLSGIGKTSTLLEYSNLRSRTNRLSDNGIFYFDCGAREMRTSGAGGRLLEHFGRFLVQIGADDLETIIVGSEKRDPIDRLNALVQALTASECLLFIDNFQGVLNEGHEVADVPLAEVLTFLLTRDLGRSRVVLASFEQWRVPDRVSVHFYELPALTEEDARALMHRTGISDSALIDEAYHLVGGHPQALQWFSRLASDEHVEIEEVIHALAAVPRDQYTEAQFQERISHQLLDRIGRKLNEGAKRLLHAASIFRRAPVFEAMRTAAALDNISARQGRSDLLSFFLFESRGLEAPHSVHPIVREFCHAIIKPGSAEWKALHKLAAGWWKEIARGEYNLDATIEEHFHWLQAGEYQMAQDIADSIAPLVAEVGRSAWLLGAFEDSLRLSAWKVENEPPSAENYCYLGQNLVRLGRPRAEEAFQRGLELKPTFSPLFNEYAHFLVNQRRFAEAEIQYKAGIDAHPTSGFLRHGYARLLLMQKRLAEAEAQLRLGVDIAPRSAALRSDYARLLVNAQRFEEAEEQFRAGIEAEPHRPSLRIGYASLLKKERRFEEAEMQFKSGIDAESADPALRNEYARFLAAARRLEDAETQFRAGIEAEPDHAPLRNEYARFLAGAGRLDDADTQFKAGIEAEPDNAILRTAYASFLVKTRRLDDAERQLRAGIQIAPDSAVLRRMYASLLMNERRFQEAETQFKAGTKADPNHALFRSAYASFLVNARRFDEAEPQLKGAIEADPARPAARIAYALFLIKSRRFEEAESQLKSGIETEPADPALRTEYARFLAKARRFQDAEVQFKIGIAAVPANPTLRTEYARFLVKARRFEEAETHFKAGIEAAMSDAILRSEYARFLANVGRLEESDAQFLAGIEVQPNNVILRAGYARLLRRLQRFAEAEKQFEVAVNLEPKNVILRTEHARALAKVRRYGEAEWQFQAGIALDPKDPFIRNAYAQLLIERGRLADACDEIVEAMALDPIDPYLHRTLERIEAKGYRCRERRDVG
jgi:predicted Zn-dependent protease/class 3 adenylate cyclase